MWGIEECAWVFESFNHIRFVRWMEMIGLSAQQMLFGSNVIPSWIFLLSPSVRIFIYQLRYESIMVFVVWTLIFVVWKWIQVIVREILFRRWILSDRKHMQPAGIKVGANKVQLQFFSLIAVKNGTNELLLIFLDKELDYDAYNIPVGGTGCYFCVLLTGYILYAVESIFRNIDCLRCRTEGVQLGISKSKEICIVSLPKNAPCIS